MLDEAKYRFRTFTIDVKKRPVPDSYLIIFKGGTDVDGSGWESSAGDRKKLEEEFKFMWNPFEAPSNNKGEYVIKLSTEEKVKKFAEWLDNQIRQFGGLKDDI